MAIVRFQMTEPLVLIICSEDMSVLDEIVSENEKIYLFQEPNKFDEPYHVRMCILERFGSLSLRLSIVLFDCLAEFACFALGILAIIISVVNISFLKCCLRLGMFKCLSRACYMLKK